MSWSGDPLRDWEKHDREQQAELDRLPKCFYCKDPIQGDFVFVFDKKCMCEECLNEHHRHNVEYYLD